MKRNETMLVYAVTGLLLVILLVAVVYGDQSPAKARVSGKTDRPQVVSLPGVAPVETGETGETGDPGGSAAGVEGPNRKGGAADTPEPADEGDTETDPKSSGETFAEPESKPPAAGLKDGVGLQVSVLTPEKQLENLLGTSTRMGEYRVVKARSGDTLNRVVDRWCADASHRPMADVLNENLVDSNLVAGQEVVVPWVDAEVLLAAEKARTNNAAAIEVARGQLYTMQRGDSLWKLASLRVAKNKVPAWLERFKTLNPDITDPSVLVAGQKVRLPR